MKKLLVTAIGAAAAFGAFADYTNAQRFEGMGVGSTDVTTLGSYWSELPNSTNTYAIVEMDAGGQTINHPDAFKNETDPANALSVKTTFGKPLSFNVLAGGAATNLESNLFFDSLVKFTVCEDVPADSYENAKIIMWLQEAQDASGNATGTNLMVRAGYLADGGVVATNYTCGNAISADFADKWHRVTIKAMPTISKSAVVPGFAIFIDGGNNTMEASSDDPKWDTAPDLTEAAEHYGQTKLFPSLIQDSDDTTKLTLTSASFDGTGTLNDMVFTSVTPGFTEAEDYVAPKARIQIGDGDPVEFTTLNEAITALNAKTAESETIITLALMKGMDLDDSTIAINNIDEDVVVVIDLNGCGITNSVGATLTIESPVTITDSSFAKTGEIVTTGNDDDDCAILVREAGTLDLIAGTIVGYMVDDDDESDKITVSGGTINQDAGYKLAEGKVAVDSSRGQGFYDIVDAPTGVAQIGTNYYETFAAALAAAADGDTITLLDNVTEPKFSIGVAKFGVQGLTIDLGSYTYTFEASNKDAIELLSSNKVTIANGTFAAASGSTFRDFVRDYNSNLTLNNVTIDGANFPAADDTKLACLVCIEGGDVNVLGSTSIINVKSAAYAIKMGNHAQPWYEMGTTTINTTGNIMGNILIAGGVYNEVAVGSGSTINYYYGKNVHSSWEDGVSSANFAARLGTLPTGAGTQDNVSGQLFKTLQAAVDAAQADDTVTVLADCTVADPIVFSAGITVSNDYTVTLNASYALRFANGNTPVTICGSGSFVGNGTGSPLLVGSNEVKSSYGIQSTYSASLVLNGCTFSAKAGQGNIIKVENGTLTVNDATITTAATNVRGVKADGDVGSYTATVIINGGTINAAKASVASSASADSGKTTSGTANVTINGGSITGPLSCGQNTSGTATITIPGTSEAKFSVQPAATYVASGYETVLSDGWYVVTKVKPSGIDPASDTPSAVVTAASADAAIEAVAVVAPTGVDAAAYKANFDFTATPNGDGTFTVTLTGIKEEVQEAVSKDAVDVLTSDKATTVDVPAGLCYKVTTYTALGGAAVETKSGTSEGTGVSVSKPGTTQGFIKVELSTKPLN